MKKKKIARGIYKLTFGTAGKPLASAFAPFKMSAELKNGSDNGLPFENFRFKVGKKRALLSFPLGADENIFGFGLQFKKVNHKGTKKRLKVNSDPVADTGDSHAPVPFFVSSNGYGILINTLENVSVSCGSARLKTEMPQPLCIIDVPYAKGIEIYVFCGENILDAVCKYNLFCGGGCFPPVWGLGMLYRAYGGADSKDVLRLAEHIRKEEIPCVAIGLEPGWQSKAYPCSFVPDKEKFRDFYEMLDRLKEMNLRVNLWEHAFISDVSPLYEKLYEYSADYSVFNGIVPDFSIREAAEIFKNHHREFLTGKGVDSFKLDECDDSDFSSSWSFPEFTEFPSGLDGTQMHSVFGLLYQKLIDELFREKNTRHMSQVRSSYAYAGGLPFVLYTDLYGHGDYLRGVINCGFSGLLFTPEVRQCESAEELVRRIECAALSPQMCVNAWMIPNPPWMEFDYDKNLRGEVSGDAPETIKKIKEVLNLRMRLVPYLYHKFFMYYKNGIPPFCALPLYYPDDQNAASIEDQYLIGGEIMVAPFIADKKEEYREIYFPEGKWHCFYSGEIFQGPVKIKRLRAGGRIPVFIKDGTLLPLAEPKQYISGDDIFHITFKVFGEQVNKCYLLEDDGISYGYEKGIYNIIEIEYRNGKYIVSRKGAYNKKRYKFTIPVFEK